MINTKNILKAGDLFVKHFILTANTVRDVSFVELLLGFVYSSKWILKVSDMMNMLSAEKTEAEINEVIKNLDVEPLKEILEKFRQGEYNVGPSKQK